MFDLEFHRDGVPAKERVYAKRTPLKRARELREQTGSAVKIWKPGLGKWHLVKEIR